MLKFLRAASTGLIAACACTLTALALFGVSGLPQRLSQIDLPALLLFCATLALSRFRKVSTLPILFLTGAAGLFLYGF